MGHSDMVFYEGEITEQSRFALWLYTGLFVLALVAWIPLAVVAWYLPPVGLAGAAVGGVALGLRLCAMFCALMGVRSG